MVVIWQQAVPIMTATFRYSRFIDFTRGTVTTAPMNLAAQTATPWSVDDKIDIFECRVDVWQLGVGVAMLTNIESNQPPSIWSHSAYGMLAITFTYFEMLGKTLNPNSRSRGTAGVDFNHGFCDVYPAYRPNDGNYADANVPVVVAFRDRVRNGMYHLAYTKNNILIHNDSRITDDDVFVSQCGADTIYYLNPHKMVRTIVDHFPSFTARLRDTANTNRRTKFETFFDEFHA